MVDLHPKPNSFTRTTGDPRSCYRQWITELPDANGLLLVDFQFQPDWQAHAPSQMLTAVYRLLEGELELTVSEYDLKADDLPFQEQYRRWVERHQLFSYIPGRALHLDSCAITKPWGEEIWYSGVEQRGVCRFGDGTASVPIPWLRAAAPCAMTGDPAAPLLLLKILAPSAAAVEGDLYFELHEEKHEAYIVTAVDPAAWPDGVGYMRYGFNPEQRASYANDEEFRSAYLEAVLQYEPARRKVDALRRGGREPSPLQLQEERSLRAAMDQFTQLVPLREGDVVKVVPLFPHALQHGVRVVEFQTATFERKILSFAQETPTQDQWDTREAVDIMRLDPPEQKLPAAAAGPCGANTERVAQFPDFEVLRVRLAAGCEADFKVEMHYCLLMVLAGALILEERLYQREMALLLPCDWQGVMGARAGSGELVFLLARPLR